MSRPFNLKNAIHQSTGISVALEKLGSEYFLSISPLRPTTPTITTLTTTNVNWVALGTGLTDVVHWRITELNGYDFHYAYEAAPGNNFSVGFGWVSYQSSPTSIYVKRPGSSNITLKFERWSV